MEPQPQIEQDDWRELVEKVGDRVVLDKLTEFFGPDFEDQEYPKVLVNYVNLQDTALATLSSIEFEELFKRNLTVEEIEEIEARVMSQCTPKNFIDKDGFKKEGYVTRADIVTIIGGTITTCKSMNLIGKKELTEEEE